ncbi:hypothetical protein HELRODRAFT_179577 [Helobdella robusta]|uniref:Uncharacterized protein n=1 Tax=Helobdella robusta TaxID=6412 RepID=T1FEW4_HELRO|nr:hypothetical protein HELRODRAFT_179577 [Helobdella robusta]ESN95241.1 hypothetical protein HELRODRAFT_179577 [Helobdella robusta]
MNNLIAAFIKEWWNDGEEDDNSGRKSGRNSVTGGYIGSERINCALRKNASLQANCQRLCKSLDLEKKWTLQILNRHQQVTSNRMERKINEAERLRNRSHKLIRQSG